MENGLIVAGSTPLRFARRFFFFGRHINFQRTGQRFPGKSRPGTPKVANLAFATSSLWAMAGDSRPANSGFSPRPLPIIGVRRAIMQCRAHDDDHRTAPLEWRAPIKCFSGGWGCRWIRGLLARNPCAIGIQPVHSRVDSCGLCGPPPVAIRPTAISRYPLTHSSTRQLTEASSMRVPLCTRPALLITASAVVFVPTPGKTGRPRGTLASVRVR
jgi:hypothetical protein